MVKSFFNLLLSIVFLPLVVTPPVAQPDYTILQGQYFGLGMAVPSQTDAGLLGVGWYYNWLPERRGKDPNMPYVPMLWDGHVSSKIPQDYSDWILILNEPNLAAQSNVSPQEAMRRLTAAREYYPNAKLVCCGVNASALNWTREFLAAGAARPDAWHVHAYTMGNEPPSVAQDYVKRQHALTGGNYWITEYGAPEGQVDWFKQMTEFFLTQSYVVRVAAYTNRQPDNVSWALEPGVEMVNDDGTLTPMGVYYQNTVKASGR